MSPAMRILIVHVMVLDSTDTRKMCTCSVIFVVVIIIISINYIVFVVSIITILVVIKIVIAILNSSVAIVYGAF